jgi:hypothetical protein
MVYLTSTGVAASTANLFISTSNNVGIGTTSPTDALSLGSGSIIITNSAATSNAIYFNQNSVYGGFEIEGISSTGSQTLNFGVNTNRGKAWNSSYDGLWMRVDTRSLYAGFHFFKRAATTATESELMTILPNGNVGVGYDSPQSRMHVQVGDVVPTASGNMATGVIISQASGGPAMCLGARTTGANYTWIHSAYTNNSGVPSPLVLQPIGGNVGIGTTSPGYKLDVSGDIRGNSLIVNGNGTWTAGSIYSDSNWGMLMRMTRASPVLAQFAMYDSTGVTQLMNIDTSYNANFGGIVKSGTNPAWNVSKYGQANQTGVITYSQTDYSRNVTIVLGSGTVQVPVAGFYQINFHSFIDAGVAGNGAIYFRVNGSRVAARVYSSEATAYRPMTINAVVSVAANDILTVFADAITLHGNDSCNFSGHLIA